MGERSQILVFTALALIVMQVLPVDRSDPPDDGPMEIGDPVVAEIVERACVDCHTNHTTWPWYSKIAPVSWWIADHVEEGREHLNLSEWGALDASGQDHKLEELAEYVENREMPLPSYTWLHGEARLTDEERRALVDWANAGREALGISGEAAEAEHAEEGDERDDVGEEGAGGEHDDDSEGH